MPVAIDVVDPADGRPVLVLAEGAGREAALLAAVGPVPVRHQILDRVRGAAQRAVLGADAARGDVVDLGPDRLHRGDEAVKLGLGFRFRRFDHQRAGHRPAHRRRVEAVVDQPLRDVVDRHPHLGEGAGVEDALMRHPAAVAHEEDRIGGLQPRRDVICVQDRDPRRLSEPRTAHHQAIGPGDQQDRGRTIGRGTHRPLDTADLRVARQMRREMRLHPDRAHARATTAMRDGEGLVQVEMADVAADLSGLHQANERVHVRAVDIDLAAVFMGDLAHPLHRLLEDAMGRGIGDHAGGQSVPRLDRLRGEILEVDVAVRRGLHHHDLHPRHMRRGRVGAMRRNRDQAHATVPLAARAVPGGDRHQPGIFALRARVRLHREGVIAGDLAQFLLEIGDHLGIALGLVRRREGMQRGELGPGDRHHLGRGVELHRTRAKRDHRPVEREVAVREPAHVAHHLAFRPVHVEDRVGEIGALPQHRLGEAERNRFRRGFGDAEGVEHASDHVAIGELVDRDADAVASDLAQVDAAMARRRHDPLLTDADLHGDRVEEGLGRDLGAGGKQRIAQPHRVQMHLLGDRAQPDRAVEDGIEARHHRKQRLRGADVRGRLLAADMLFAGLQAEPVGLVAAAVDRDADDAAGHRPLQLVARRHEGRVRSAIAHRHAEALRRAHGDIGPHRARLLQQAQRQKVGRDHRQSLGGVELFDQVGEVADMAMGARILEDRAEDLVGDQRLGLAPDDLDTQGQRPGLDHADRLRMQVHVDEEGARLRFRRALGHGHRLGRRRRLVKQRGVRHRQAGEIRHHRLVVQKRLEPALRDLRLIGRIGGVPGRVFQDVALDRRRRDRAVIPLPDQRGHHPVLRGDPAQLCKQRVFGHRPPAQRARLPDRGGHRLVDQCLERGHAHRLQHLGHLGRARPDMAAVGEIVGIVGGGREHGINR
ncbi:hypothetical protein SDC9_41102 [bioreactor metagenome]|uniref:Uncharacterized protein n=1 Tax=bioreactor metagenome TaxID=1076179 RepID=A0A644VU61_9ZZZZ